MKELYNKTVEEIAQTELNNKTDQVKSFIKENLNLIKEKGEKIERIKVKIAEANKFITKIQEIDDLDLAISYIKEVKKDDYTTAPYVGLCGLSYTVSNND